MFGHRPAGLDNYDYATATAVSISGGQENGNNYLLDGGDHNDSHSNCGCRFGFPTPCRNSASRRMSLGPVRTSSLRRGERRHPVRTNHIHGDLFEFVRNGDLNARNFFPHARLTTTNQFGEPGVRSEKIRFSCLADINRTRVRTAPPQTISFVPTQAAFNRRFQTLESARLSIEP